MGLHYHSVADWLAQYQRFPGPQPGQTPTRRAVAVIEARLARRITGRLVEIEPQDLRTAVKLLARQFAQVS